jgi:formate dehydrogenase subunit gamma
MRIPRYTFVERVNHWIAGLSYLYLLLTGLALWTPWLFWMAAATGGGQVARYMHPWIGLIFFVSVMYMYPLWGSQMREGPRDRDWWRSVGHYARNEDESMPPIGRYNPGQKLLFWGFFWLALVLVLTGLVLWFPEYIGWNFRWLRYIAVILHPIAALLSIGLFLIHIYMGIFAERGALDSMISGDVTSDFVRRYHPGWYEEITGKPAQTRSPAKK